MSSLYNLYNSQSPAPEPYTDKVAASYSTWPGQVPIDLAPALGRFNPVRHPWASIFTDDDFCTVAPLPTHATSNRSLCNVMARIAGIPAKAFAAAIAEHGIPAAPGTLRIPPGNGGLENQLELIDRFAEVLLSRHASREQLVKRFVRQAAPATFGRESFPLRHVPGTVLTWRSIELKGR